MDPTRRCIPEAVGSSRGSSSPFDPLVISTGRRNSSVEYISWGFPAEGLAGTRVQLSRHHVELLLGDVAQIHALRIVLPKQAVRVLVRATLPRTLRRSEEHTSELQSHVNL